jgi:hypothetical protein
MKHTILFIGIYMILFSSILYCQTITHPWKVVDNGGGKSTGGEFTLQTSIGQSAVQRMVHIDTGKVLESGYIPGLRTLSGASTTCEMQISQTWNLISLPLIVTDSKKTTLFPTSISPAYYYNNGYMVKDTLRNGEGYWLKFGSAQAVNITGTSELMDTIDVNNNWNIIGVLAYPILVADIVPLSPVTISSNYFGYTPGVGYYTEDTLKPGQAYWLKVSHAGEIILKSGSVLLAENNLISANKQKSKEVSGVEALAKDVGLDKVTFRDADGRERSLYFTGKQLDINLSKYELPPPPPSGIFDVRFASQRNVELSKPNGDSKVGEYPIQINGVTYPLTLSWEVAESENYKLELTSVQDNKILTIVTELLSKGEMVLDRKDILAAKLMISSKGNIEIPKEYALYQNYPNPFNPITKIKYDLPIASKVIVKIYNLLGQEVTVLKDEIEEPGFKSVEFDGSNLSSGVYFYRIDANGISIPGKSLNQVKKLMLIK